MSTLKHIASLQIKNWMRLLKPTNKLMRTMIIAIFAMVCCTSPSIGSDEGQWQFIYENQTKEISDNICANIRRDTMHTYSCTTRYSESIAPKNISQKFLKIVSTLTFVDKFSSIAALDPNMCQEPPMPYIGTQKRISIVLCDKRNLFPTNIPQELKDILKGVPSTEVNKNIAEYLRQKYPPEKLAQSMSPASYAESDEKTVDGNHSLEVVCPVNGDRCCIRVGQTIAWGSITIYKYVGCRYITDPGIKAGEVQQDQIWSHVSNDGAKITPKSIMKNGWWSGIEYILDARIKDLQNSGILQFILDKSRMFVIALSVTYIIFLSLKVLLSPSISITQNNFLINLGKVAAILILTTNMPATYTKQDSLPLSSPTYIGVIFDNLRSAALGVAEYIAEGPNSTTASTNSSGQNTNNSDSVDTGEMCWANKQDSTLLGRILCKIFTPIGLFAETNKGLLVIFTIIIALGIVLCSGPLTGLGLGPIAASLTLCLDYIILMFESKIMLTIFAILAPLLLSLWLIGTNEFQEYFRTYVRKTIGYTIRPAIATIFVIFIANMLIAYQYPGCRFKQASEESVYATSIDDNWEAYQNNANAVKCKNSLGIQISKTASAFSGKGDNNNGSSGVFEWMSNVFGDWKNKILPIVFVYTIAVGIMGQCLSFVQSF